MDAPPKAAREQGRQASLETAAESPAVLEQRIGRIYRLGQALPIDVYNLVTEEGIESNIAKLLGKKSAVFSSLFDGTSDAVIFDGSSSFLAGVKQLVDPVSVPLDDSAEREQREPRAAALGADVKAVAKDALAGRKGTESSQLRGLSVARTPNGGLRIEAPPELAAPLADLLEALARSLRSQKQR